MTPSGSGQPPPDPRERFTARVADYVRYRPDYPVGVLDALRREGLGEEWVVADVGSGTGIFSELLLRSGARVLGVEPNDAMRAAAEEWLGGMPGFRSLPASAEATTLPERSVDLVTAAQAFHWFDPEATAREFRRILRPGGLVALVWNNRRNRTTPFLRDYEALLQRFGTDYGQVNHRNVDSKRIAAFFGREVAPLRIPHSQELDHEGLRGRLLSSSYTPAAGDPRHEPMLEALDGLFARHQRDGRVRIDYDTELYLGELRGPSAG